MGKPGGHYREPASGTVLVPDIAPGDGTLSSGQAPGGGWGPRRGPGKLRRSCAAGAIIASGISNTGPPLLEIKGRLFGGRRRVYDAITMSSKVAYR
jgi:hypothetical protein